MLRLVRGFRIVERKLIYEPICDQDGDDCIQVIDEP